LVEGSSPSPVTHDNKRIMPTGNAKTPCLTGQDDTSSPAHPILSSCQDATDSASIRPLNATPIAARVLPDDRGLAAVVAAWPELPEAVKAGVAAMVKAVPARRDRPDREAKAVGCEGVEV
jgi:hypothetical protein